MYRPLLSIFPDYCISTSVCIRFYEAEGTRADKSPLHAIESHSMDQPSSDNQVSRSAWSLIRALPWCAMVLLGLGILGGAMRLITNWRDPSPLTSAEVSEFFLCIMAGMMAAGLLLGLWGMLLLMNELRNALVRVERYQYELGQQKTRPAASVGGDTVLDLSLDSDASGGREKTAATLPAATALEIPWREIVLALQDIRDNTLLSETERHQKKSRVAEDLLRSGRAMLTTLIEKREFAAARRMADDLARRFPNDPQTVNLAGEVEEAREKSESGDVANTSKQVNDLISISAWQRARDLAQQLQQRHPDSTEARQLLIRIEREYRIAQGEQQRRMYAEIQRYVTRKRWEEALAAANTFIERFPDTTDADALRIQVATLQANAQIEYRQQLESQIMDFTRHGRYMEAVELARKVIERYPDSPQAEALRNQIGRLEELATDPAAPPARVRVE
jgi:tetratricopeptide (TPR) repeat protein